MNADQSNLTNPGTSDATVPQLERPTDHGMDSLTSVDIRTSNLPAAPTIEVPKPPFVRENDTINISALRNFLMDEKQRHNPNPKPGSVDRNRFSTESLLPVVVWATGVQPLPEQTSEQYFEYRLASGRLSPMIERLGTEFCNAVGKGLLEIASGDVEKRLPHSDMNLRQIIKLDPVSSCVVMIDEISPCEGFGTTTMASALERFREICLEKS